MNQTKPGSKPALGLFHPAPRQPASPAAALLQTDTPLFIDDQGRLQTGAVDSDDAAPTLPFVGMAPSCPPERLGDPAFCRDHGLRFAYVGGSMAKGISSVAMAQAFGAAGMLGFFGAAGLPLDEVEQAIAQLQGGTRPYPFGMNLIHSPNEPDLEAALVDLYLTRGVRLIEASAFLDLTLPVVRFRVHGIHRDVSGQIITPNRIIAKLSREELAAKFLAPPPERLLRELVADGRITAEQAELAAHIPMAQDVTVEADSGGHTDNRPAISLFPSILALRDKLQARYHYDQSLRLGLGGGIATPASALAAFAMGAAYLVTGTVNQACVESGTCDEVRKMLAETRQADITMAPSADMFEMGVQVQVLKRGTMFSMRAARLLELYRQCGGIDQIPAAERQKLENTFFRAPLESIWEETRAYFAKRDPRQVERAQQEPKHKMALIFRWYLGQSPVWANRGESSRKIDYQIWCGPAMGAFNEWTAGTFLEDPTQRRVVPVALNLLLGAAYLWRARQLILQGFPLAAAATAFAPLENENLKEYLR